MSNNSQNNSWSAVNASIVLEDFFRDFYYELLKCKELALRTSNLDTELNESLITDELVPTETSTEKNNDSSEEETNTTDDNSKDSASVHKKTKTFLHSSKVAQEITEKLIRLLALQTERVLHLLDKEDTVQFRDAQYAMTALADEIFITLEWNGNAVWKNFLIEGQLFQSQSAGEKIFQKIELLLAKYDMQKISLAKIYFFILALGFKGKHSGEEGIQILKNYQKRLYAFINDKNPSLADYRNSQLNPQCYSHTIMSDTRLQLPDLKFWIKTISICGILYLLISFFIWHNIASNLHKSLDYITEQFKEFISK